MKRSRRDFVRDMAAAGALSALTPAFAAQPGAEAIRGVLLHMGMNMWGDWLGPGEEPSPKTRYIRKAVHFDAGVWRETTDYARAKGLNMVVMDIGDFVRYPSHPELAIDGCWTPERLHDEVVRLRKKGLEPIPKLNFASTHDSWLKEYHRMLSTRTYYRVVEDLIRDIAAIFEKPRFLHIGWDEESLKMLKDSVLPHVLVRQQNLWWHDFLWNCEAVRSCGMRPWTFCGPYGKEYVERCPKDVVQSNAYYDMYCCGFDRRVITKERGAGEARKLEISIDLDRAGLDQIPLLSEWVSGTRKRVKKILVNDDTPLKFAAFNRAHVSDRHRLGFLWATWLDCKSRDYMKKNMHGIDLMARVINRDPLSVTDPSTGF